MTHPDLIEKRATLVDVILDGLAQALAEDIVAEGLRWDEVERICAGLEARAEVYVEVIREKQRGSCYMYEVME